MFETALLESTTGGSTRLAGRHRIVAIFAGMLFEFTALGALILVPLIHTLGIDLRHLPDQVVPLPPPPPAVKIIAVVREKPDRPSPNPTQDRGLIAPTRIPDEIRQVIDDPAPPAAPDIGVPWGDPNSIGIPTDVFRFYVAQANQSDPPPAPPERHSKPKERRVVGGDVQAAKLIYAPKPDYPQLAKIAHVQGTVRLEAIIAVDGRVQDLRVASGHPMLIQAALEAVSQWRYQPTLLNGEAVEVQTEINVNFILQQ